MALNITPTAPAATLIKHGNVTIQFNGLHIAVGFDIHAEVPIDQKKELIHMAAVRCVDDFFAVYRGEKAEECEVV